MTTMTPCRFTSVYGPVPSWRYGRSLGIDAIGAISTCSFNCVYCQLGDIQSLTTQRQVFVATETIIQDLEQVTHWDEIDVVTLSGSGEPTLARNLDEILQVAAMISGKPTVVLTNSSLMNDVTVRLALRSADYVAAKVDAITLDQLRRINRATATGTLALQAILTGLQHFRAHYDGVLAIQTMVLSTWTAEQIQAYSQMMRQLQPEEIQLNLPRRRQPLRPHLATRGNPDPRSSSLPGLNADQPGRSRRCLSQTQLQAIALQIEKQTQIPVRYSPAGSEFTPNPAIAALKAS